MEVPPVAGLKAMFPWHTLQSAVPIGICPTLLSMVTTPANDLPVPWQVAQVAVVLAWVAVCVHVAKPFGLAVLVWQAEHSVDPVGMWLTAACVFTTVPGKVLPVAWQVLHAADTFVCSVVLIVKVANDAAL